MVSRSARTLPSIWMAVIVPPAAAAGGVPRCACAVPVKARTAARASTAQRTIKRTPGTFQTCRPVSGHWFIDRHLRLSYPFGDAFVPRCGVTASADSTQQHLDVVE